MVSSHASANRAPLRFYFALGTCVSLVSTQIQMQATSTFHQQNSMPPSVNEVNGVPKPLTALVLRRFPLVQIVLDRGSLQESVPPKTVRLDNENLENKFPLAGGVTKQIPMLPLQLYKAKRTIEASKLGNAAISCRLYRLFPK